MGRWQSIVSCALLLLVSVAAEPRVRPARISVELFTDQGIGVDTQRWYQLFTDLGLDNLRIRGAEAGDEIGIRERGKRRFAGLRGHGPDHQGQRVGVAGRKILTARFRQTQAVARQAGLTRRRRSERQAGPIWPHRSSIA